MASVALGVVGGFVGSAVGGPAGARYGWAIGTLLGSAIEGSKSGTQDVGKLDSLGVTGSGYGAAIPWIYGRHRCAGNVLWATRLQETSKKSGVRLLGTRRRTFSYTVSCAVMICRGPITEVRKIKADDLTIYDSENDPATKYDVEIHLGTWDQEPDATIEAVLGAGFVPAYRGRAYVVFKDLPLGDWGNRLPNFEFEVENSGVVSLAFDDFNRADANLGTSSSGHTWLFDTFNGQVVGNLAHTSGIPGRPNWIETGEADVEVQLTAVEQNPVLLDVGWVAFRLTDEDNCWRFGAQDNISASGFYEVIKTQAGVDTQMVLTSTLPAAGDVLKVVCIADRIRCYVNGVQVVDLISSFNQSATKHGFGADSDTRIDDWSCNVASDGSTTLGAILADVFDQVGLEPAEWDVTEAVDEVEGFKVDGRSEARQVIAPLLQVYATDLLERDGLLAAKKRGGASVVTIPAEDLAARIFSPSDEPPSPVQDRRLQELELPFRVDLAYHSATKDYEIATQGALRYTKLHLQEALTLSTALVFTDDAARQKAEELLYRLWVEREGFEFSLPPRYAYLTPGDVITLPVAGGTARVRLTRFDLGLPGPIRCEGVLDDVDVLTQVAAGGTLTDIGNIAGAVKDTLLLAWSSNAVVDDDADTIGFYAAATGLQTGYWPGAQLWWSRDGGTSYQELAPLDSPAIHGTASTVLAAGTSTGTIDTTNTVDVLMTSGVPETVSDSEMLAGENRARLGSEIIGFGVVTPLGGGVYRLSRLLRGRRGTDPYWGTHQTGEAFVLLEDGLYTRVEVPDDLVGDPILLKATTADGQALAEATAQTLYITGNERKPYSPVAIAGSRDGGNNLSLSWHRRVRSHGDLVDFYDAPLDEATEAYEVKILNGTQKTVTAITKAAQAQITATGHGYSVSQIVYLSDIKGMVEMDGLTVTVVSVVDANNFQVDVDSTDFTTYVSGGSAERVLRSISAVTQTAAYSAANQTSDGLTPGNPVRVAVYQIGQYGRGYAGRATV